MRIRLKGTKQRWPTDDWCSWFAWHPVVVAGHLVWLETVSRRWSGVTFHRPGRRDVKKGAWEYTASWVWQR